MKNFVFIFMSLFFATVSYAEANLENCKAEYESESDANVKARKIRECIANKVCEAPFETWSDLKKSATKEMKDNKIEARNKGITVAKDKASRKAEILEQIADAEKAAQDAEVAYGKAKKDLQDALDQFEKSANEQGQELVKEIQNLISKLEKNLTVDRDELNTEYQNSLMQGYEACKQSAEQLFMTKLGLIRDANKKQNGGYSFSGGASLAKPSKIKKARAEAKKAHLTCVTETKRVLEAKRAAALQKLALEEKRLNQELTAKQQELDRITNTEYKKKLASLESELQNAQKELISAQEKSRKDIARLQQQLSDEMLAFDNDSALQSAIANEVEGSSEEEQKARKKGKTACCNGNRLKKDITENYGKICEDPPKPKASGSKEDAAR